MSEQAAPQPQAPKWVNDLQNLVMASTQAKLNFGEHQAVQASAKRLQELIIELEAKVEGNDNAKSDTPS